MESSKRKPVRITEGKVRKGGLNPPNTSTCRPAPPQGSGGESDRFLVETTEDRQYRIHSERNSLLDACLQAKEMCDGYSDGSHPLEDYLSDCNRLGSVLRAAIEKCKFSGNKT